MSAGRLDPRRPPYWLLPAFIALMLAPPAWAVVALLGAAIALTLLRSAIALRGRRAAAAHAGRDGVVLGLRMNGEQLVVSDRQLSAHGLILGASGAGKSTTLLTILADLIARGSPVVAIDLKGSPTVARELATQRTPQADHFESGRRTGRPIGIRCNMGTPPSSRTS